ncbi:MAG: AAA family ATPase [Candidatus Absconditabacterales bacterium]
MPLIGNQNSIHLLKKYISSFLSEKVDSQSFFIVAGPANIGKSEIVQQIAKDILGQYFQSDFLYVKDFGNILGKKHELKVGIQDKKTGIFDTLLKEYNYLDIGIREINTRLQQSSMGKTKIVLLENIERMNRSSANAFLKNCEEPLKNKLIIATTSHPSSLLETIISRAIMIRFKEVNDDEILSFAKENSFFSNDEVLQKFLCGISMGKPGVLVKLNNLLSENEQLKNNFSDLITFLTNENNIFQSQEILKNLNENGSFDLFLDGRISYCTKNGLLSQSQRRLKVKKMKKANVNIENLFIYGLLGE